MAGVEYPINAQLCLGMLLEVGEGNPPSFIFDVGVTLERDSVNVVLVAQVALEELVIMVLGDLVSHLQEGVE